MLSQEQMIDEYRRLHGPGRYQGMTLRVHQNEIIRRCESLGVRTVLDYGCGQAFCWKHERLQEKMKLDAVALYDPAVPEFAHKPGGHYHAVLAMDVLEHIHEDHVLQAIAEICGYAERIVYATICCRPSRGTFSDGTNFHCTIRSFSWWRNRFTEAQSSLGRKCAMVLKETP